MGENTNHGYESSWKLRGVMLGQASLSAVDWRKHQPRIFRKITFIDGKVNSSIEQTYNFTYDNLMKGKNYFRLKQIDLDGHFVYSPLVSITSDCRNSIAVFPNPVSNTFYVSGLLPKGNNVQLTDVRGIIVANWNNTTQADFNISALLNGIYTLTINGKNYKLVKQ